jgi:hypothetical protein
LADRGRRLNERDTKKRPKLVKEIWVLKLYKWRDEIERKEGEAGAKYSESSSR